MQLSMFPVTLVATLTTAAMCVSIALAVVAHAMRRELDPVEAPFSAYLSGTSRAVGLACYMSLGFGIVMFALATAEHDGSTIDWTVAVLYVSSAIFLAIAAATARADLPLSHDNPHTRWWHRQSSFFSFLCAIGAIALHAWAWRGDVFYSVWPLPAYFAAALACMFVGLWFSPLMIKGLVQKLLIAGIIGWFSWVALLLRH
jgi:hypothetical protein